jgi:hypothetical protein
LKVSKITSQKNKEKKPKSKEGGTKLSIIWQGAPRIVYNLYDVYLQDKDHIWPNRHKNSMLK